MATDIKSLDEQELRARFAEWKQPAYRVGQVLEWLYAHRAAGWEAMTNLPKALRERLASEFTLQTPELVRKQGSSDTTQKFLWRLADHALIESVLIPANPALYGEASDRHTLCVSTQVGCAYGCKFCASGLDGFKRNLGAHEIVEQVLATERWNQDNSKFKIQNSKCASALPPSAKSEEEEYKGASALPPSAKSEEEEYKGASALPPSAKSEEEEYKGASALPPSPKSEEAAETEGTKVKTRFVDNLVIMGMGEPLANYENLLKALRILNAPWGGGIGARKITISTSGLAPQIRKLAEEPLQFRLAISLHGATDETRNKIMPVNRRYPLAELTAACEFYQKKKERMITLEYILIAGVNDGLDEVRPLAQLARRLEAKVNLIPYNRVEGLQWERPEESVCEGFLESLEKHKVTATLRREKGHDIDAACGQLRLKTERELAGK